MNIWTALSMVLVALLAWGVFGGLVWQLQIERADYASALERSKEESLRGESAARLRTSVESTVEERAALGTLIDVSILRAVEVIEQAGRAAGATDVSIGGATPAGESGGLPAVAIVVNANGSFGVLMRAVALYESLPIPASLEQFGIEKGTGASWRLTARLKVLTAPSTP